MLYADKPKLWEANIEASIRQYNGWYTAAAPKAYADARATAERP